MQTNHFFAQFAHPVRNIIFDLGGVVFHVNYLLTIEAFQKAGFTDIMEKFSQIKQSDIFDRMDCGLISDADFRNELRKFASTVSMTDEQINRAWNAMLIQFSLNSLETLQKIKPHFRTFLLSNTNSIHAQVFEPMLEKQTTKGNHLSNYFEKVYYSHEIHQRKPNKAAFDFVINNAELNPAETLFIDDLPQNIEGAKQAGLQAYCFDLAKGEKLSDLFSGS